MGQNEKMNPIDQIKELVFGREMESYEDRFQRIESSLSEQIQEVTLSISEAQSVCQDRLENERDGLLEQMSGIQDNLKALRQDFETYRKKSDLQLASVFSLSLSKKDFSEALLEMSFRFTEEGGTGASKSKSTDTATDH